MGGIRQCEGGRAGERGFGIGRTFETFSCKSGIGRCGKRVVQRHAPAGLDAAPEIIGILLALQYIRAGHGDDAQGGDLMPAITEGGRGIGRVHIRASIKAKCIIGADAAAIAGIKMLLAPAKSDARQEAITQLQVGAPDQAPTLLADRLAAPLAASP